MSLERELGDIRGDKLTYMLMRVSGLDTGTAKKMLKLKEGTYNAWLRSQSFIELHRRVPELIGSYQEEALRLLRRENRLSAILLESEILAEMREEVRNKVYKLVKTNLARTVYERVIDSIEEKPSGVGGFRQQLLQIFNIDPNNPQQQIEVINANPGSTSGLLTQPQTSTDGEEGQQEHYQGEEQD